MKKPEAQMREASRAKVTIFDSSRYSGKARKPMSRANAEVYLSPITVELFSFDEAYLRRLAACDLGTETHFVRYFTELMRIKLRNRMLHAPEIEDVINETFTRVLTAIKKGEIRQPERLGAYVNSVCNNVLAETYRDVSRNRHQDVDCVDVIDPQCDIEETVYQQERQISVHSVLRKLACKDRAILCAHFLQEMDKDEICRMFDVDRGYMRVLLHRAKMAFQVHYKPPRRPDFPPPPRARGGGAQ